MNQATNHGMDMNQGIGIRAYVARIRKARECSPDDLRYITPNTSRKDYEHLNRGNTYFLCFFANPSGHMPQAVRVDDDVDSDSLGSARERLFLAAGGDKSGDIPVAFLVDASAAAEDEQLSVIARICTLFFRNREYLAAIPWTEFDILAAEMTKKGVMLVSDGWRPLQNSFSPTTETQTQVFVCFLPQYLLNLPRTPDNQASGPHFKRQQAHLAC